MFLGVENGLGISVVVSLFLVLNEMAHPHIDVLGKLPGSVLYRNAKLHPDAEQYDGLIVCSIGAPMYFANTEYIREVSQNS